MDIDPRLVARQELKGYYPAICPDANGSKSLLPSTVLYDLKLATFAERAVSGKCVQAQPGEQN